MQATLRAAAAARTVSAARQPVPRPADPRRMTIAGEILAGAPARRLGSGKKAPGSWGAHGRPSPPRPCRAAAVGDPLASPDEVASVKITIPAASGEEAELISEALVRLASGKLRLGLEQHSCACAGADDITLTSCETQMEMGVSVLIEEHRPDGQEREKIFDAHVAGKALWRTCDVVAFLEASADAEAAVRMASQAVGRPLPFARGKVLVGDWARAVREAFRPVLACEGVWVVPQGSEARSTGRHVPAPSLPRETHARAVPLWPPQPPPLDPSAPALHIILEPGLAFGTGEHPTTRLCLSWLKRNVRAGDRVLDYGAGSGVLAIAAILMGAAEARGTDTDPLAVRVAARNAQTNGVDGRFACVVCGPSAEDATPLAGERFDIVVANILQGPLLDLRDRLVGYAAVGARVAVSGIVEAQVDGIVREYSEHLTDVRVEREGDWALVWGVKRGS